jgi:hypothetical protein
VTERTAAERARETIQQYREIVAAVVGFVRSQEITRAYSSISLEELVDRRIARIEAPAEGDRPGALARLTSIKTQFDGAIDAIKAMPPDSFRAPSPSTDANTSDNTGSTT